MPKTSAPAVSEASAPAVAPAAPVQAKPERKPVEEWAKLKGHSRPVKGKGGKPELAGDWRFAAAKAHDQWPVGLELSEADYDDAVKRATGVSLR